MLCSGLGTFHLQVSYFSSISMYTKNDPFFLDYENLRYVMQYDKKASIIQGTLAHMFDFVWWKWISNWSIISCLYLVLREFFVLMLNIIGTPLRKVMMICNNLHAIMLFWVQWTLTTLKYFYRGKKSLYLYSVKNFFPYLMCDIINLLMQT